MLLSYCGSILHSLNLQFGIIHQKLKLSGAYWHELIIYIHTYMSIDNACVCRFLHCLRNLHGRHAKLLPGKRFTSSEMDRKRFFPKWHKNVPETLFQNPKKLFEKQYRIPVYFTSFPPTYSRLSSKFFKLFFCNPVTHTTSIAVGGREKHWLAETSFSYTSAIVATNRPP
jgi:hypothetical protein